MRKLVIAKTNDIRYLVVVYGEDGQFLAYRLFRQTAYYRQKIRAIAKHFKAQLPGNIRWDLLPKGNFIEWNPELGKARVRV